MANGDAFRGGAVVAGNEDDERVIGIGELVDRIEPAANLVIGEGEESRDVFHLSALSASQAGTHSGLGVSLVSGGMVWRQQ